MLSIKFSHKGNFSKTLKFFNRLLKRDYLNIAEQYAAEGLEALKKATPKESGYTAECWNYRIENDGKKVSINYVNSHVEKGVNIAIILQYGHGTRNGGYVVGIDYINPTLKPVFDKISNDAWNEIVNY